jgi:hypothetical protein
MVEGLYYSYRAMYTCVSYAEADRLNSYVLTSSIAIVQKTHRFDTIPIINVVHRFIHS